MKFKEIDGKLVLTVKFDTFLAGIHFVNKACEIMESKNHHADIDIKCTTIVLTLCTHDAGHVITEKDHDLASDIEGLLV